MCENFSRGNWMRRSLYGEISEGARSSHSHKCAVDKNRIELDERLVRDVLGLGDDAVASVARLRTLLASEPSIHGSKVPELPGQL